jgi:iron(II)-dependent oxidoreductase
VDAVFAYLERTLERTIEALDEATDDRRYFGELALLHEDMHGEAMLMTLQTLSLRPRPSRRPRRRRRLPNVPAKSCSRAANSCRARFRNAGVRVRQREMGAHGERAPFTLSMDAVTQGEFMAFTEEGGYRRRDLWQEDGWKWRETNRVEAPRYWQREEGRWLLRRFDRWMPVELSAPMVHVSLHEALAFCAWSDRRLPTERSGSSPRATAAARTAFRGATARRRRRKRSTARISRRRPAWMIRPQPHGPAPDDRRRVGVDVERLPAVSRVSVAILTRNTRSRGSVRTTSFAAAASRRDRAWCTNRFRNFYLPERADIFAGLRTCAVEP